MKKILSWLMICFILISLSTSIIGCSSSKKSEMAAFDSASPASNKSTAMNNGSSKETAPQMAPQEQAKSEEKANAPADSLAIMEAQNSTNPILADRKVIFNSFMVLEVEDFDTKFKMINSIVQNSGIGYLQSSNIRSTKISSDPEKYRKEGSIVLRVAQNKFENVLTEVRSMGTVLDDRTNSEEITDQYYDAKYRTQMYEAEREKVMEYLKKANDLNTMLQLEKRITEITYEIERLKGSLRKWDNLVEFSTITIELHEKVPENLRIKSNGYGERLLDALMDSFEDTIRALGNLVIGIIRLLPTLTILGLLFLIARPFIAKFFKKKDIQG
ncbi:MAG: DUF4349 domain-containing protein [Clostridia bacterium]